MEDEKPLGLKILVKILDTIAYLFFASILSAFAASCEHHEGGSTSFAVSAWWRALTGQKIGRMG
jgi:hypothetical protein